MDEINDDLANTDVVLVIGATGTVNPGSAGDCDGLLAADHGQSCSRAWALRS
jgi:H+-translocating NAD(P) transhydrogenase subunit beta